MYAKLHLLSIKKQTNKKSKTSTMQCAKRKAANELKSVMFHYINLHMNFNIMPKGEKTINEEQRLKD